MTLNDYQKQAISNAIIYSKPGTLLAKCYCGLKMAGEAGEYADKLGKAIRDDDGIITPERRKALMLELGDVLWYVAMNAHELDFTLEEVAIANGLKLADRKQRGTSRGSGDER